MQKNYFQLLLGSVVISFAISMTAHSQEPPPQKRTPRWVALDLDAKESLKVDLNLLQYDGNTLTLVVENKRKIELYSYNCQSNIGLLTFTKNELGTLRYPNGSEKYARAVVADSSIHAQLRKFASKECERAASKWQTIGKSTDGNWIKIGQEGYRLDGDYRYAWVETELLEEANGFRGLNPVTRRRIYFVFDCVNNLVAEESEFQFDHDGIVSSGFFYWSTTQPKAPFGEEQELALGAICKSPSDQLSVPTVPYKKHQVLRLPQFADGKIPMARLSDSMIRQLAEFKPKTKKTLPISKISFELAQTKAQTIEKMEVDITVKVVVNFAYARNEHSSLTVDMDSKTSSTTKVRNGDPNSPIVKMLETFKFHSLDSEIEPDWGDIRQSITLMGLVDLAGRYSTAPGGARLFNRPVVRLSGLHTLSEWIDRVGTKNFSISTFIISEDSERLERTLTCERIKVVPARSINKALTGLVDEVVCTYRNRGLKVDVPSKAVYIRDSQLFIMQSDEIGKPTMIEIARKP
jgi:hypothetical protein